MGLEPTTSLSAALGCIGFMNAALGFRLAVFFATFLLADFLAAFFFFAIETSPVRGPNVDCGGVTKNLPRGKVKHLLYEHNREKPPISLGARLMRPGLPLVFALLALQATPPRQGESSGLVEEILQIEDRRASGESDVARLREALAHRDSLVVRRAARALGRLERPELVPLLFPLLHSPFPAVRSTAAEGIAQAAQGLRGDSSSARIATWTPILAALLEQLREESDPEVRGMLALSLGRLPYDDPMEVASVRRALIDLCSGVRAGSEANTRFCRGAEALVRATWRRVALEDEERHGLRDVILLARAAAPRRHALGALVVAQRADDSTLTMVIGDPDAELRRLALTGVRREGSWESHPVLTRGLRHNDAAVRLEALRALSRAAGTRGCGRLVSATRDSV